MPSAQRWSTPLGGCHDDWLFVDPAFGASVGAMMEVVAIKSPFQTVAGGVEGHWVQVDDVMLVVELNPH